MPNNFRNINYGRLLYEALRNYFSVNGVTGQLTIFYKFMAAVIQPLQPVFDAYVLFRIREALIASCKWQIGQLTNVLNYLYDNTLNRIFITQASAIIVSDPIFAYPPDHFDREFAEAPIIFERQFGDTLGGTLVTIHIPVAVDEADLKSVVEQIRMQGIPYLIETF